jgi:integrase
MNQTVRSTSRESGSSRLGADPSIREIIEYYLEARRGEVKWQTWTTYYIQSMRYVVGPLLSGSGRERYDYTRYGTKREDAELLELLGPLKLSELSTAEIRRWHRTLSNAVSGHAARVAKKHLRAALALAAEDFDLRVPAMPAQRGRGVPKPRKRILTPTEVGRLLSTAQADQVKGIYYAFPFLTGVRPSEQLALQWNDIDFQAGLIRVRRAQLFNGSVTELTKTEASTRDIPISPLLRTMLLRWHQVCPFVEVTDRRVFPCLGSLTCRTHKKRGTPLSYANFCGTYWKPAFRAVGLPYVTPHSARHVFISTLQASGIEIGVVAKLAGHADPAITLSHYTQPVRDGSAAVIALEATYCRDDGAAGVITSQ